MTDSSKPPRHRRSIIGIGLFVLGSAAAGPQVNADSSFTPAPYPAPKNISPVNSALDYVPVSPFRLADSRLGRGFPTKLTAGDTVRLQVPVEEVHGVALNITAVNAGTGGHVAAWACGSAAPETSAVNYRPGSATASFVNIGLGAEDEVCFRSSQDIDLIVDVAGYYADLETVISPSRTTPRPPWARSLSANDASRLATGKTERLYDSRTAANGAPKIRPDMTVEIPVPAAPAVALGLNLTITEPVSNGYATIFDCAAGPGEVSSINFAAGETIANFAWVPSSDHTVCVNVSTSAHVVVDLQSSLMRAQSVAAATSGRFNPITPVRLIDTRVDQPDYNPWSTGAKILGEHRIPITSRRGLPANTTGVTLNVIGIDPAAGTFATFWPCARPGGRPDSSTVNPLPAKYATPNSTTFSLDGGNEVCVYTNAPMHIVIDITAVWTVTPIPTIEREPVILVTDLNHPFGDPDDHIDVAVAAGLELNVVGLVLEADQGRGVVPAKQIEDISGSDWPTSDGDAAGAELILDALSASPVPVEIVSVGSLRIIAAAWRQQPQLFRTKVAHLSIFAGDAADLAPIESNVSISPNDFVEMMGSGLPIRWAPCFDGGLWSAGTRSTFVQTQQRNLFPDSLSPPLQKYFSYRLLEPAGDPIDWIRQPVTGADRDVLSTGLRNVWAAGIIEDTIGDGIVTWEGSEVGRFVPMTVRLNGAGQVDPDGAIRAEVERWTVIDAGEWPRAMVSMTVDALSKN